MMSMYVPKLLQKMKENSLNLSASKTVVCPKKATILG